MRLIAGPDYGAAAGTLRLLMLSVPPIFLAWIAWMVLMAIDRTHVALWRALAAVGVNVALNLLVLPRWGIEGAAVVTFLTESVACVLVTGYLFRQGYGFACLDTALKTLSVTAAVTAVTWLLGGAPLLVSAAAAGFTFVAALWATGDKKKADARRQTRKGRRQTPDARRQWGRVPSFPALTGVWRLIAGVCPSASGVCERSEP
jgi:O-antigen/teichoic acid export membrane protein